MKRGFVIGDRILSRSADTHPDWCAGFGRLGNYCVVGASAIGRLHIYNGVSRDDAFAIRSAGSWLAVAVSDGVGSRPQSRYGASFAVEMLCAQLLYSAAKLKLDSKSSPFQTSSELVTPVQSESKCGLPEASEVTSKAPLAKDGPPVSENIVISQEESLPQPTVDMADQKERHEATPALCSTPKKFLPHELASETFGTMIWYRSLISRLPGEEPDETLDQNSTSTAFRQSNLEEVIREAFKATRASLEQFAQSQGTLLRDFHCTLLGLLLNVETSTVAVGHIGDGLILGLHDEKGAISLVEPRVPDEPGTTYLLTQVDWESYFDTYALPPEEAQHITTFYLMTDGVADDCLYGPPVDILQRWANDMNREIRRSPSLSETAQRLSHFLANYQAKGSYDDRTLVVVFHD